MLPNLSAPNLTIDCASSRQSLLMPEKCGLQSQSSFVLRAWNRMSKRTLAIIIAGTKYKSLLPLRNLAILSCSQERFWAIYFENCIISAALNLLWNYTNPQKQKTVVLSSGWISCRLWGGRRHSPEATDVNWFWKHVLPNWGFISSLAFYIEAFKEAIRLPSAIGMKVMWAQMSVCNSSDWL